MADRPLSQRIQRCSECRQVRGMTAFRVLKPTGGRHTVCRWCEQTAQHASDSTKQMIRSRIAELRRLEGQYVKRLADVREEIVRRKAELNPPMQSPTHTAAHRQSA